MSKVAIIGRPNVGKSTLFNRLVGKKLALVDDQPGVTRDRREGEGRLYDLAFTVVDTAGLEEGDPETLAGRMRAQTETALADCDAILFVIDARAGVTGTDRHFAAAIRRAGKPIIVIANKAESGAGRDGAYDAFSLGLGDPIVFSAEHGVGMGELYDALAEALPPAARLDPDEEDEGAALVLGEEEDGSELDATKPLRIAVLGRPNAGKSTLLNRILGKAQLESKTRELHDIAVKKEYVESLRRKYSSPEAHKSVASTERTTQRRLVLNLIAANPDGPTSKQIADRLELERAFPTTALNKRKAVTTAVSGLRRDGLIVKVNGRFRLSG